MKTYIAQTEISLSIRIGNGAHMHIRFNPSSNGGSVYTTASPVIQKGLERHPQYGKMFHLASESKEEAVESKPVKPAMEEAAKKNVIKVTSLQDAKDYLVETFGISRTQLTSKAKILANAASHNIEFDGIS